MHVQGTRLTEISRSELPAHRPENESRGRLHAWEDCQHPHSMRNATRTNRIDHPGSENRTGQETSRAGPPSRICMPVRTVCSCTSCCGHAEPAAARVLHARESCQLPDHTSQFGGTHPIEPCRHSKASRTCVLGHAAPRWSHSRAQHARGGHAERCARSRFAVLSSPRARWSALRNGEKFQFTARAAAREGNVSASRCCDMCIALT